MAYLSISKKHDVPFIRKRFACHSADEIDEKRVKSTPINTIKANNHAAKVLRTYLAEKNEAVEFEVLEPSKLSKLLSGFYLDARTVDGELYKATSIEQIRHSLNRHLKAPPHNKQYDIIKDRDFIDANESFKAALREMKSEGKGSINHHPVINDNDLKKLYTSFTTTSPIQLQEKVRFDIRLYFFRRGSENMHDFTKDTFAVKVDASTGERYVCKVVDELNKNHTENDHESYTGFMPECRGSPQCPVASFEKYIEHLNPSCPRLWQKPKTTLKNSESDTTWYHNIPLGVNSLRKFMADISCKYELSIIYKNHSVRATGATILSRHKFGSKQIMSVTGHKSVSSLAVYQRVSQEEKLEMGKTLNVVLGTTSHNRPSSTATTAPAKLAHCPASPPASPPSSQLSGSRDINFQLSPFFKDLNISLRNSMSIQQPAFYGCKIKNLTVNIYQHPSPRD